ncbi:MAG TPA: NAD(P)-dependent alcohol dehydrogenase [Chloroflexota bacterium]|nr:NAD(P)-dependent alcohol dehydrogenase [Chloroflexota bacterium]
MNAIVCDRYGPPESLKLEDTVRPAPDDDRVLVRVRAVSINPADLHNFGGGLIVRMTSGMQRPRTRIPWSDVAGVVEAVGRNVTVLRPGDEVFGTCAGSLAEYALGGKNLVPMPAGMTFEQAAALPIAGITALQGLRDKGRLQPGQSVLINGAAGGVGTFAVQIAKALGAEVTGVCSTRNADMVRSIGADDVVDYTREDFARRGKRYDLVFDLVGNRSLSALRRAAKPGGTLVLSGGAHDRGHGGRGMVRPLMLAARGLVLSKFVAEKIVFFIAQINKEDLLTLKELGEAGKVRPVIDRTCPLDAAPEAFRYLKTGHVSGKVVITV